MLFQVEQLHSFVCLQFICHHGTTFKNKNVLSNLCICLKDDNNNISIKYNGRLGHKFSFTFSVHIVLQSCARSCVIKSQSDPDSVQTSNPQRAHHQTSQALLRHSLVHLRRGAHVEHLDPAGSGGLYELLLSLRRSREAGLLSVSSTSLSHCLWGNDIITHLLKTLRSHIHLDLNQTI